MSVIKSIMKQLGLSVTPANNFTLTAAADNGTMKLARGNAGATTQDIMTVDAAGKVAIPQGLKGLQAVAACTFNGTPPGTGTLAPPSFAFNVSRVNKNGPGNYTIHFATLLPNTRYTIAIVLDNNGPGLIALTGGGGIDAVNILTYTLTPSLADNGVINVTIFGEVA